MKKEKENKKNESVKKKKHIGLKIFLAILIILLVFVGYIFYKSNKLGGGLQGLISATMGQSAEQVKNMPKIRCLLIGKSQELTDTIILAEYDPQNQTAKMLSIPRDTYIGKNKQTATAMNKINALYQSSPEKLLKAVSDITGLEVTNYVTVDTKALVKLVDAIGGVDFDVPTNMNYDDDSQNLHIHLKKGYQHLNGKQAEGLVRFRKNNDGTGYPAEWGKDDYGRMRTQREFIQVVLNKVLQAKNIFKLGELTDVVKQNVQTNLSEDLIKDYLPFLVNFNIDNIETNTIPGESEKITHSNGSIIWIFVHNDKETKQLVNEMFLGIPAEEQSTGNTVENTTKTADKKINVMYVSSKSKQADTLVSSLKDLGYKVTKEEIESAPKTLIINRKSVPDAQLTSIKNLVTNATVQEGKANSEGTDLTIILGKN